MPNLDVAGVVVAGAIEAAFTVEDFFRFYKMLDEGVIDEDEFYELAIKRLMVALFTVAGSELGPIVAFSVSGPSGMFIGAILGNIFGKLAGRAVGEVVVFGKNILLTLLTK